MSFHVMSFAIVAPRQLAIWMDQCSGCSALLFRERRSVSLRTSRRRADDSSSNASDLLAANGLVVSGKQLKAKVGGSRALLLCSWSMHAASSYDKRYKCKRITAEKNLI